jgi:hypothetical protein
LIKIKLNVDVGKLSLTEMQQFLNEEASHCNSQFNKYPSLWVLLFLYTASSAILVTMAFLCSKCNFIEQNIMLWFGLLMLVSLVMFVIIPNILRVFLNCFYERPKITVKKMWPLSLVGSPKTSRNPMKSFREKNGRT